MGYGMRVIKKDLFLLFLTLSFIFLSHSRAFSHVVSKKEIRPKVRAYINGKLREYREYTEKLKALLESKGISVPETQKALPFPKPTKITITIKRNKKNPPAFALKKGEFIDSVEVYIDPSFTKGARTIHLDTYYPGGMVLAADDLTAQVFGLPHSIPLKAIGYTRKWVKVQRCIECCIEKCKGKEKCFMEWAIRESRRGVDVTCLLGGAIKLDLEGTNLKLAGTHLVPRAPGRISLPGKVTFTSQEAKEVVRELWGCKVVGIAPGRIIQKKQPVVVKRGVKMAAQQRLAVSIEDVRLRVEGKSDFFEAGKAYLYYEARLEGKWVKIPPERANLKMKGNSFELLPDSQRGRFLVRPTGIVGKTTVNVSLGDSNLWPRFHTFTFNRARMKLEAPRSLYHRGSHFGRTIPVDKACKLIMEVYGPADMNNYMVKWSSARIDHTYGIRPQGTYFNVPQEAVKFQPGTSSFTKKGNLWMAETEVTVSSDALKGTILKYLLKGSEKNYAQVSLTGSLVQQTPLGNLLGEKGKYIGQHTVYAILSSPPIKQITLKGCYEGMNQDEASEGPFDLFIAKPGGGIRLLADIVYGEGMGLKNIALPTRSASWIKVQQAQPHMLKRKKGLVCPRGDMAGIAKIRAVIKRDDADKFGISIPEKADFIASKPVKVRVNQVYLTSSFSRWDGLETWKLVVEGPSNMASYKAIWHTSSGDKAKGFVKVGKHWESAFEKKMGKGAINLANTVDIINKDGVILASISGAETPHSFHRIVIEPPGKVVQGVAQKIVARIYNLPEYMARRAYCEWHFEGVQPEVLYPGFLRPVISYLRAGKGKGEYYSYIVIRYPEDIKSAGKSPHIKVDLLLKE